MARATRSGGLGETPASLIIDRCGAPLYQIAAAARSF
jgi:hypothetical protein